MRTTTRLYRNKRNEHKIIEVRNDGYYHNTVRQYIEHKSKMSLIRNYTGDGCLHRWRIGNLRELLEDYEPIKA